MINDDKFDAVLDMSDPDFIEKFKEAVGLKPGETLEILTPQFDRADGRHPVKSLDDWDMLRKMSVDTLKELGCGQWSAAENGTVLMLFPAEWYDKIPDGFIVTDINGEQEQFQHGKTDNDRRFGCLAYGVEVAAAPDPDNKSGGDDG